MAQIKVLKIGTEGIPEEHGSSDDLSFNSYTAALAGGFSVTSGVSIGADITFNSVTDTIAGIQNQNLLDKTSVETISGAWTFGSGSTIDATNGEFTFPNAVSSVPTDGDSYWDGDTLYVYNGTSAVWSPVGGSGGSTTNLDLPFIADEILSQWDAVYISATDAVSKAQANPGSAFKVIGFITTALADTSSGFVRVSGIVPGVLTGAIAGTRYFLSKDTAGAITSTIPTGPGKRIVQVGFAKNATDLVIDIQFMGIRS